MAESKMCHNMALENKKINKGLQTDCKRTSSCSGNIDTRVFILLHGNRQIGNGIHLLVVTGKNNPLVGNMATIHFSKPIYNPLITHKVLLSLLICPCFC